MFAPLFSVMEWVYLVHGSVGAMFAIVAAYAACEDYQYSRHPRVKRVALKNMIEQSAKAMTLCIMAVFGFVGVLQEPTASQVLPTFQTWLFYVGTAMSTMALAGSSAYSYFLYAALIGSAHGGRDG